MWIYSRSIHTRLLLQAVLSRRLRAIRLLPLLQLLRLLLMSLLQLLRLLLVPLFYLLLSRLISVLALHPLMFLLLPLLELVALLLLLGKDLLLLLLVFVVLSRVAAAGSGRPFRRWQISHVDRWPRDIVVFRTSLVLWPLVLLPSATIGRRSIRTSCGAGVDYGAVLKISGPWSRGHCRPAHVH